TSATIIASVREADTSHLLRRSGADSVVGSSETAGRLMGLATVTPSVTGTMEDPLSPDEGFSSAARPATESEVGGNRRVLQDIVLGIVRSGALYRIDSAEAETVEPGDRILYVRGMGNLEEGEYLETSGHLDPEQLRAATAPRGPVAIIAGAGTGKTRTITHRIAHLVDGGFVNPDQVLAVTFTSRAASEMRERDRESVV